MKISVIGATGFVGSAIVNELRNRNHDVVAIARNIRDITITIDHQSITKKPVDVADIKTLVEVINGSDAVVSAFNAGWSNPNLYQDYIKGALAIQKAVEASDVNRFIVIGGAGSLKIDGNFIVDSPDFPKGFYPGASAVRDYFVHTLSKNDTLDWLYFSPAIEMNQTVNTGRTGKYRLGNSTPVFDENGKSVLSVEDLAVAIVDELENKRFHREQFTASY